MHSGERWKLGHRPGLDGLRGVAILLVLASHYLEAPRWRSFGIAGVTVFFVLSGFLITALLLEEHEKAGRISLAVFYARRARRLLPALTLMLLFVTCAYLVIGVPLDGIVVVALYIGNWPRVFVHPMRFLDHTWSLGVEEQFYILWPLVLMVALRRSRRAAFWVAVVGALVSLSLRFALWSGEGRQNRVWFATDTNAYALLAGCALAIWLVGRPDSGSNRPRVALVLLGCAAVVSLAYSWEAYTLLVPPVAALVTVGMIWCLCRGGSLGVFGSPLLRFIGRRSYGYYLWHIPILLTMHRLFSVRWDVNVAALAVTVLVAEVSWRLVESPILRRGRQVTNPHVPVRSFVADEPAFQSRVT